MDLTGGPSKNIKKDESEGRIDIPLPTSGAPQTLSPKVLSFKPIKGVESAKKRLQAFSIQKKTPITPIVVPKPSGSGNTTVLIGKLAGVKMTPKIEPDPELKKLKPPKPGATRRFLQESYTEQQKKTLSEIEDMKKKMELVELGIPLGLICPTSTSEKAMPTKAMPPIKSFLGQKLRVCNTQKSLDPVGSIQQKKYDSNKPSKVDELIREAKKAKQEGKKFKFDYQKLLPDYDNPFQKKKDDPHQYHDKDRKSDRRKSESEGDRDKDRKSDKYDQRRYDYKKTKYREKDRGKTSTKSRNNEKYEESSLDPASGETNVNLNDYLVCDSWSLENDDKNSSSSPKSHDKTSISVESSTPSTNLKINLTKRDDILKTVTTDSPIDVPIKIEKLQPVMDCFKYEIDPNDDEILDIFDKDSSLDKYAQQTKVKVRSLYDSPDKCLIDYDTDNVKDSSLDGLNDDIFLESVINEIKQENLSDEGSQDKGLVEYDMSPSRDEESPEKSKQGSVTPEINDKIRTQSQRSDYSEDYKSSDSYKSADTSESGYKSVESFRLSVEKELDEALEAKMSKSTVDSLETWSFVLKICQPLLFRHDKNKCYRETRTIPKIWYTENPKVCACVKDRSIVYEELEMCKMSLVDRVYGCDQIPDAPFPKARKWYPKNSLYSTENTPVPVSNEWEAEDSQQADRSDRSSTCATPQRSDEMSLDREYQRFMEAVWPDVVESKKDTSRSTTPVRQESRKKKKDVERDVEERKPKKIKLSSEGWSQESDIEEEDKSKKVKIEKQKAKARKRKYSTSTLSSSLSETDEDAKKKRKLLKKKAMKKTKSKSAKRRRIGRKLLRKLKENQKKKSKDKDSDDDSDKKKDKKMLKKRQEKLKKKAQKKKKVRVQSSSSSSSTSSSTESDSESDRKSKKAKKQDQARKKKKRKVKQRTRSTSDSTQSEDLFDVNILNNIKTERLTDDEKNHKMMEFSPRRQKPREIINVKELQNDFVGNVRIKQEVEDTPKEIPKEVAKELPEEEQLTKEDDSLNIEKVLELETDTTRKVEMPKDLSPPLNMTEVIPLVPVTVEPSLLPSQPTSAPIPVPVPVPAVPVTILDESQGSSQESICSVKDAPIFYEKDESHLRPSSQNSNYSFNDVISASQNNLYPKELKTITANQKSLYDKELEINVSQCNIYPKGIETVPMSQNDYNKIVEVTTSENVLYDKGLEVETECDDKYGENYEAANYEMYEQMAMAYQSDVASQQSLSPGIGGPASEGGSQRIETVVGGRSRGEIKCDWRAGDAPATPHRSHRPSRWGLKPGEVNIVLTGAGAQYSDPEPAQPVYHIQSLANRTDMNTGYDEAYMDMYGASDRLQYGDCFGDDINIANITFSPTTTPISGNIKTISPNIMPISANINIVSPNIPLTVSATTSDTRTSTLDARIDKALRETVLGGIAQDVDSTDSDKDVPEKGILITSLAAESRGIKRVSFADGYKPGQDSDVEEPPAKKRKKPRRYGCAWPCPATHPDHVPLWDALPPPPPPPGSPPPPRRAVPPLHLLRTSQRRPLLPVPPPTTKFDPTALPIQGFMPPEPPPGLIALQ